MTLTKNKKTTSFSKKAAFKGALFLTLSGLITACGSSPTPVNQQSNTDTQAATTTVAKQDFTKGVVTTIEEVKKGEFKIVDEQTIPKKEDSKTIVKYVDGKVDTLNTTQMKAIAAKEKEETYSGNNNSMGNAMWWGLMGLMVGRSFSSRSNPGVYNNQKTYQRVNNTTNADLMKSRRTVTSGASGAATRAKAPGAATTPTTSKPADAKKGFFNSGSKSTTSGSSSGSRFGG